MVFQIVQDSPWRNVFVFGCVFVSLALMLFAYFGKTSPKATIAIFAAGFSLFVAGLVGILVGDELSRGQSDASFSKQLMDEYHATSSRSFQEISLEFASGDEANTVFTEDGKETRVFVKFIKREGHTMTMAFTVLEDKALYPKAKK